jgi:V/A-type H+-transporting ATPase subunit D
LIETRRTAREHLLESIQEWLAVLAEDVGLADLVKVEQLDTEIGNVAGVEIPIFKSLTFVPIEYDIFAMPLWVDAAIDALKQLLKLDAEVSVLTSQHSRLRDELRTTSQRVNLFEKVKIPETGENIRTIQIYLGDEQTAAVVRGKIAKARL